MWYNYTVCSAVEQVGQLAGFMPMPEVGGSNPPRATKRPYLSRIECLASNQEVGSSNLPGRTEAERYKVSGQTVNLV